MQVDVGAVHTAGRPRRCLGCAHLCAQHVLQVARRLCFTKQLLLQGHQLTQLLPLVSSPSHTTCKMSARTQVVSPSLVGVCLATKC
jgi:hypothetical protein